MVEGVKGAWKRRWEMRRLRDWQKGQLRVPDCDVTFFKLVNNLSLHG